MAQGTDWLGLLKSLANAVTTVGEFISTITPDSGNKRQTTCALCGRTGHNAATCPYSRACGICGRRGHNSATCPEK
ncbi:MAG: hypothetical protein HQK63_06445 [Desulfamplus sp.]|nr:hypothetical protein [Desulfamplus sp.]